MADRCNLLIGQSECGVEAATGLDYDRAVDSGIPTDSDEIGSKDADVVAVRTVLELVELVDGHIRSATSSSQISEYTVEIAW